MELAKSGKVTVVVVDTDQVTISYSQAEEKKLETVSRGHPFNQEITRGFGFGGSSNLWHGVLTTLDEQDWQILDSAAGSDISKEVIPLYGELENIFGELSFNKYPRVYKSRIGNRLYNELERSGKFKSKDFFVQKRPFRTRKGLNDLKNSCANLIFVENATAINLIGNLLEDPSKATGLVVDINGQKNIISADYFILAAGALETPRIVLQSTIDRHYYVDNDNVGQCLFDHPWTVIGEISAKQGWFRLGLSDIYAGPGLRYRIGYRLTDALLNPKIGSNHCISIKPVFFGDYSLFKDAMKAIISMKPSFKSLFGLFTRFKARDVLASIFLLICERFGLGVMVKRALVFCYLEQPLRCNSSVSLSDKKDSHGRMIPIVDWLVGQEEHDGIKSVINAMSAVIENSEHFRFVPYENAYQNLASGAHHAGTMRIGTSVSNGVVDKDLKILGSKNVFVCDLSIFPNYGNSNPALTLSAFSLRLSRHILGLF